MIFYGLPVVGKDWKYVKIKRYVFGYKIIQTVPFPEIIEISYS